jgi:hypothetical protein
LNGDDNTVKIIIISLLIIIALSVFILTRRIGLIIEYSQAGFKLWVKISFVKVLLFPPSKDKKKKKVKEEKDNKSGGDIGEIRKALPIIREVLGKLKRRLIVDNLTLRYLSACPDPAQAALSFGAASAGAGILLPLIESSFTVRKKDIQTNVSFTEKKSSLYVRAQATISVVHLRLALTVLNSFKVKK